MSQQTSDCISVPTALHRSGCAALSGVATTLLQARQAVAAATVDLHMRAREVRAEGQIAPELDHAIATLEMLATDIMQRRAAIVEMHRDFRGCDPELTPTRPPSDAALRAYQTTIDWSARR